MNALYLFLSMALFTVNVSAQTLGIKIDPGVDMLQGAPNPPHFGIACGLFYSQKIYRPLGFSVGLDYQQIRYYTGADITFDDSYNSPKRKYQSLGLVELPVDLTLLMNENKSAKCLVYFTIGYAFGQIFENSTVSANDGITYITSQFNLPFKGSLTNSFHVGLEARYNPISKLNLALGVQYKYIDLINEIPYNNSLDSFNVVSAYVKTGLNFLHKKKVTNKS